MESYLLGLDSSSNNIRHYFLRLVDLHILPAWTLLQRTGLGAESKLQLHLVRIVQQRRLRVDNHWLHMKCQNILGRLCSEQLVHWLVPKIYYEGIILLY